MNHTCVCVCVNVVRISPDLAFLWKQSGERFGISQLLKDCICVKGQRDIGGNEVTSLRPWGSLLISTKAQTPHLLFTQWCIIIRIL